MFSNLSELSYKLGVLACPDKIEPCSGSMSGKFHYPYVYKTTFL